MPRGIYQRRTTSQLNQLLPYQGEAEFHHEIRQLRPEGVRRDLLDPSTGWPRHQFPSDPDPGDGGAVKLNAQESLSSQTSSAWTTMQSWFSEL